MLARVYFATLSRCRCERVRAIQYGPAWRYAGVWQFYAVGTNATGAKATGALH